GGLAQQAITYSGYGDQWRPLGAGQTGWQFLRRGRPAGDVEHFVSRHQMGMLHGSRGGEPLPELVGMYGVLGFGLREMPQHRLPTRPRIEHAIDRFQRGYPQPIHDAH